MAAFLPNRNQPPLNPPTPPDQRAFNAMEPHLQHTPSTQARNGARLQHGTSGEYIGSAAYGPTNGNGALPVPTGPHALVTNGQPRNMGGIGGAAAFDGPRSPSNTKSEHPCSCETDAIY